ncbi:Metalloenzyme, LuxS/M16 peptidase-like protein [Choanephora cucurbitarum]|nr:Metalloenzyme, LuxS/M16 peptidase-like protein [Choanephora cucurbitarum]
MVSPTFSNEAEWKTSERFSLYTGPLEKSASDNRDYRLIRLNNQLQALLIQDLETDRASAALDVRVGSHSNPRHLQGLAHFCEHLLFLGTKKYPKENDYSSYLSEHSGDSNAYTSSDSTNYFFEVGHQWLEGALDRFSRFFIDPLFSERWTDRELRAVDSEYKKDLQSDYCRVNQVQKTLSNPNHPWHMFEIGNLETLMDTPKKLGLDTRQELLKFHDTYYSANLMRLVIVGRESLDQLTEWAVEKFSAVINKDIPVPSFPEPPLTSDHLQTQIFIKPVRKTRTLDMAFPFPDQSLYYECQPAHYISHLVGHEGPGSILSFLKKKNWATYLSSGMSHLGNGYGTMNITIELTEKGLANYENVVVSVFEYFELIKESGIKKWIFDEIKSLAHIHFRFSEKYRPCEYTSFLSEQMQDSLPPQYVISGNSLLRKYDPLLIEEHMALLRPDNFRLTLVSQELPKGIECTKTEKWYSTEYEVMSLSEDLLARLKSISKNDEFALPEVNEFIPQKLDVNRTVVNTKKTQPDLIQHTSKGKIWYKMDDTFWVPKTNVWIVFQNSISNITPYHAILTELYVHLLTDSLAEYSYNAQVAGLSYYFYQDAKGLHLCVNGYSDRLPLLLEKIIRKMKNTDINLDRFHTYKDELTRCYENFHLEMPLSRSDHYMMQLINEKFWTYKEYLNELETISIEDLQSFLPSMLASLHIEGLVHGTLTREETIEMFESMQHVLQSRPLLPSQLIGERAILLPEGQHYIYSKTVGDPDEVNSAINYQIQVGDAKDVVLRNHLGLVAQIATEPCFNQLRTLEQLGYIVFSGSSHVSSQLTFYVMVQSERDAIYLENRVLEFLESLRVLILEMSEKEFQSQIDSLIADRKEKPKNLQDEGQRYWNEIYSGYYEFDTEETDIQQIGLITKDSLLSFYDTYIMPESLKSKSVSVHMVSQKEATQTTGNDKFTAELAYPVLVYLELIDKKQMPESDFKALLEDKPLQTESDLRTCLSSTLRLKDVDLDNVIEKIKQGPSALSKRDHTKLPENYIHIHDHVKFKNAMGLSVAPTPFYSFQPIET